MSSPRPLLAAVLALALLASVPGAHAHGGGEGAYDPLVLDWHAYLTAEGRIEGAAPAPGALAFPAAPLPPTGASAPLRFGLQAPVAFAPSGGFEATLTLRVDRPLVHQGDALEVTVTPGGESVRVPFPGGPVFSPGTVLSVVARVQAPSEVYERGEGMELVLTPLVAALPEGALSVVTGGDSASRFDALGMRVPTPADLRLQDVPHTEIVLGADQFTPPANHAVNAIVVAHGAVTPPAAGAWSDAGTYVLLRGEEADADARTHAIVDDDARRAAAHLFRVNGIPARVHPGLGVIVRVPSLPIRVACEANCPAEGFSWSYAPASSAPSGDAPSVLVPPPRDTSGIPVSEDEPDEKPLPFAPAPFLAFALAAALALAHGRRR